MTNLNIIFHVVVSVYRLVKIWNSPQFPAEFRNGLLVDVELNQIIKCTWLFFFSPDKDLLSHWGVQPEDSIRLWMASDYYM